MTAPTSPESNAQGVFARSCAQIRGAYDQLGHKRGWRFLTSPAATLDPSTPIALITLNPGGREERPDHAVESSEAGSAYVVEAWKQGYASGESPLQRQVRRLFQRVADEMGTGESGDKLLHESLGAYFIPFRSPSIKDLVRRQESLGFARELWTSLFSQLDPRLVITIDRDTTAHVSHILEQKMNCEATSESFPVGWGNVAGELLTFGPDGSERAVLRFPHLSRFRVFGREMSEPHLRRMIRACVDRVL